jgi:hypothetical protein
LNVWRRVRDSTELSDTRDSPSDGADNDMP